MDKLVSEWVNANLEKYPLISQIKTNNNNTTTERCCSLQETDAETWYFWAIFENIWPFLLIFGRQINASIDLVQILFEPLILKFL